MTQPQQQPYDSALKSLLGDEVAEILPKLLPDSEYIDEQNIEVDRTTLKADLVYNIKYKGKPSILNMELQTDEDPDMPIRMLRYHVGLYDKHRKPVISMVIYPFETALPRSPFEEISGEETLLTFHFRVLPLWKLDAQDFVRDHVVPMYTLLPAMKGANASLLLQAIEEMKQKYTKSQLARHLTRFRIILLRSSTISEQDKQIVEDQLQTYDSLLEQDPYFQQRLQQKAAEAAAEAAAKAAVEAAAEAEIRTLQRMALDAVEDQYPSLKELAQEKVTLIRQSEVLRQLVRQIYKAPDEVTVRWLLNTFGA